MKYLCLILIILAPVGAKDLDTIASEIGFPGGLIVHVNPTDLGKTVALRKSGAFLIHALFTDKSGLDQARTYIVRQGLAGKVTASILPGNVLPFISNSVNLLLVESDRITKREALRVLTPRGIALWRTGGEWKSMVKPVPATIDDWTHNLYNPTNNAVSKDVEVGPPRHLQWVGSPKFCRSHNATNSFQAMVSCAGRVFYMMDEGSIAFLSLPSKWFLTARDGFNGKVLWKKALPQPLADHLDLLKSGIGNLAHRMVAEEDVVYATLGFNAPVSALDARTGKERWTSEASANTEELLLSDGLLYCVVNLSKENIIKNPYMSLKSYTRKLADSIPRKITVLNAKTGAKTWEYTPKKTILPFSMTIGGNKVFLHDGEDIVALDKVSGKPLWKSAPVKYWKGMRLYMGVTLVYYDGVLLFSNAQDMKKVKSRKEKNQITALDAESGKVIWNHENRQYANYFTTVDLMVADGLLWSAGLYNTNAGGEYIGIDPKTGTVVKRFKKDPRKHMPHHRCHRNRGAKRYLFIGRTGVDAFDVKTGKWNHDYWARGTCRYGMMPANGILYLPPNSCACFASSLIRGFNAMTAATPERKVPKTIPEEGRLVRGPAYSANSQSLRRRKPATSDTAWPTLRGSASRHGMAATPMSTRFTHAWKTSLTGKLTQPVIANGKVVVSLIDQHTICAIDEATGRITWSFLAGGRVNSPPTLWNGCAIFGCNDGWVYNLTLSTGKLIWKYRAAPVERRLISRERLESPWPVNGSVLVLPDKRTGGAMVYCVAGRSMFLDGGLRMIVLDAATGKKHAEILMDNRNPQTGKDLFVGHEWPPDSPTTNQDILSYYNAKIYMGQQAFDLTGKRYAIHYPDKKAYFAPGKNKPAIKRKETSNDHLFATTGFLDDNQWHRAVWYFGSDSTGSCWSVNVPAFSTASGNILAVDNTKVYGYGREFFVEGTKPTAHLFRVNKHPDVGPAKRLEKKKIELRGSYYRRGQATTPLWDWSEKINIYARALIVARNTKPGGPNLLFAAGAPDVIEEYDAIDLIKDQQRNGFKLDKIYQKQKAVDGKLGARFIVVSTKDGRICSQLKLAFPPVFDGMAAADGKIFIANMNGEVICLNPQN